MENSLKRLEEIKGKSLQEVKEIALEVFNENNRCLQAASIYAKCLETIVEKEEFLKKAIKDFEDVAKNEEVSEMEINSYFIASIELGKMYIDYGKLSMARRIFERLMMLKNNETVRNYLLAIYAYFEDRMGMEQMDQMSDVNNRTLFPFAVYAYKISNYDLAKELINRMVEIDENMKTVLLNLDDEEDIKEEEKESYEIIRFNAFLLESVPYFISFVKECLI